MHAVSGCLGEETPVTHLDDGNGVGDRGPDPAAPPLAYFDSTLVSAGQIA